ncbi:MAG: hypothetical protein RL033_6083 [Pseudomonadota bacterium]
MKRLVSLVALLLACGGAGSGAPPATAPGGDSPAAAASEVGAPTGTAAAPAATQTAQPQELTFPEGEAFRLEQPSAGSPRSFQLPQVKSFTLESGLRVFLVERHALPLVSLDLNFEGGGLRDPAGKEGLAAACMDLLTESTVDLDKIQLSEALGDIASSVDSYTTADAAGVRLFSLSKHFDATFALFADVLRAPGLRASDFERLVKRRIETVRQNKGIPASVANRVSGPVLYGATHPFGAVTTEASLGGLQLDDCKRHLTSVLAPQGARLFVVGDLTEAQVRAAFAQGKLAAWRGAPAKLRGLPSPSTLQGRIAFVHIPGAAQSSVSVMHFGPKRTASDYFPTTLMASVFGGSFSSRINMNLREAKGYSYGARGGFSYNRQYGVFSASAAVRTDSTYQTLLEIDREVRELAQGKRPVLQEELEREKQGAILGLPGQFATSQSALAQYRSLVYFDLPLDYYNGFVGQVGKVTEAQVKAAAAKHLVPGRGVYVVVGDGDAKMIVRDPSTGQDVPYSKDGQQLTLRQALAELARRGDVGKGALIELDADGRPKG